MDGRMDGRRDGGTEKVLMQVEICTTSGVENLLKLYFPRSLDKELSLC